MMNVQVATKLLWELDELMKRDRWTHQQVRAHQAHALHSLREFAYAQSPFYTRFHKGKTNRPLSELPILTTDMLIENFDQIVTDRSVHLSEVQAHMSRIRGDEHFRGQYWVSSTPGDTGRRGFILFDDAEWTTALASSARARQWAGMRAGVNHHLKLASVLCTVQWGMMGRSDMTLDSNRTPALHLDASLALDVMVQRLNEWQPEVLIICPFVGRALAEEQISGRLRLSPQHIFTCGEVLTTTTRQELEAAWGKRLFNQYAMTGCGELGAECNHHTGMHLFEDLVVTEVVDEHNRPVPPGVHGDKVLVTVLYKRAQPLIRYEISDRLRMTAIPCTCGRPFRLIDNHPGYNEWSSYPASADSIPVGMWPSAPHRVTQSSPMNG